MASIKKHWICLASTLVFSALVNLHCQTIGGGGTQDTTVTSPCHKGEVTDQEETCKMQVDGKDVVLDLQPGESPNSKYVTTFNNSISQFQDKGKAWLLCVDKDATHVERIVTRNASEVAPDSLGLYKVKIFRIKEESCTHNATIDAIASAFLDFDTFSTTLSNLAEAVVRLHGRSSVVLRLEATGVAVTEQEEVIGTIERDYKVQINRDGKVKVSDKRNLLVTRARAGSAAKTEQKNNEEITDFTKALTPLRVKVDIKREGVPFDMGVVLQFVPSIDEGVKAHHEGKILKAHGESALFPGESFGVMHFKLTDDDEGISVP